jgi:hypothetical protein
VTTPSKKPGTALRVFMVVMLVVCGVLGYGYWHAVTHASFHIDMNLRTGPVARPRAMPNAEIVFLDESGAILARGVSDSNANFVHLLHPEVGDCHEREETATVSKEGKTAWQECFTLQSVWIPTWAQDLRQVDVTYNGSRFDKIPVTVSEYNSEWFLWWVPLPHVGGKPYTYFRATINVDARDTVLQN